MSFGIKFSSYSLEKMRVYNPHLSHSAVHKNGRKNCYQIILKENIKQHMRGTMMRVEKSFNFP